jgi:AraC-like DNA-binding protein
MILLLLCQSPAEAEVPPFPRTQEGTMGPQDASPSKNSLHVDPKSANAMMSIPPPADTRIQKVLLAIDGKPSETIQNLSRLVNLSSSRLSHLFKAQTGWNLSSLLWNRRMDRAADLLRSTEMRVKEITDCVGYGQMPSFNRAFKKKFGTSPTCYRSRQRLSLRNS